jgi:hypothetical protein
MFKIPSRWNRRRNSATQQTHGCFCNSAGAGMSRSSFRRHQRATRRKGNLDMSLFQIHSSGAEHVHSTNRPHVRGHIAKDTVVIDFAQPTQNVYSPIAQGMHPSETKEGAQMPLRCLFWNGEDLPILASAHSASDGTVIEIRTGDKPVIPVKLIGTSAAGQSLYGEAARWVQTRHGMTMGEKRGDVFVARNPQPELTRALRTIDARGMGTALCEKILGGAKSSKFERALDKWITADCLTV